MKSKSDNLGICIQPTGKFCKVCFNAGYKQAQTQTKLKCLKDELEFLELHILTNIDECNYCYSNYMRVEQRISQLQQEIKEIEK